MMFKHFSLKNPGLLFFFFKSGLLVLKQSVRKAGLLVLIKNPLENNGSRYLKKYKRPQTLLLLEVNLDRRLSIVCLQIEDFPSVSDNERGISASVLHIKYNLLIMTTIYKFSLDKSPAAVLPQIRKNSDLILIQK